MLGQGPEVGVVVHVHRDAVRGLQPLEHAVAPPGGEHHLGEATGLARIDRARHGHAHAEKSFPGALVLRQTCVAELADERFGPCGVGAYRVVPMFPIEHLASKIREDHGYVRGAYVHAQHGVGIVPELEQDRPTPSPARAVTALGDETCGQERGNDLGDGGPRQARLPSDIRPRYLALLPDKLQRQVGQGPASSLDGVGKRTCPAHIRLYR